MRYFRQLLFLIALAPLLAVGYVSTEPMSGRRDDGSLERRDISPLEARADDFDLEKRDCKYWGCKCRPIKQGQYCGWCWAVKEYGRNVGTRDPKRSVYECGPNGECCNYGYRQSCTTSAGPCGPNGPS